MTYYFLIIIATKISW